MEQLKECVPTKAGCIEELIIDKEYRSKKTGTKLIEKLEEYFKKKKCNVIRIDVFEPNKKAYNFYKKLNYKDRMHNMIKIIK